MHYTPAQTRWFAAAIDEQSREEHRLAVVAARVAQAADAKAVTNYLDALSAAGAPKRRPRS